MNELKINNYGIMIIPKGTILYHVSEDKFNNNKNNTIKPLLFCTFHPYNFSGNSEEEKYIHYFELIKDVKLFFMISNFFEKQSLSLFSSFSNFFNTTKKDLSKISNKNINTFLKLLEKYNFDGWFSSIDDVSSNVEIALFNNKKIYKLYKTNYIEENWYNNQINNNFFINFGEKYKISTIDKPITLIINKKFKNNIEKIKNKFKNNSYKSQSVYEEIIKNSIVYYLEENNNNHNKKSNNIVKKYIK